MRTRPWTKLHDSDAQLAAVAERLGHLNSVLRSAVGESERLAASLARAEANIVSEQDALEAVAARLAAAQEAPAGGGTLPGAPGRPGPGRLAGPLGRDGGQARPAQRRGTAHGHPQPGGVAGTRRRHRTPRPRGSRRTGPPPPAPGPARRRRRRPPWSRSSGSSTCPWSWPAGSGTAPRNAGSSMDRELAGVRSGNDALARELAELTDSVHRDELARTQQRLRIEALELKSVEELGLTADQLVADYGPDQPVPGAGRRLGGQMGRAARPGGRGRHARSSEGKPFVREEQEKRLKRAERDLVGPGQGQPAGAGGVRRAGGTPPVPQHPARGPEVQPQGPAGHHQGSRRPRAEGLRRGLRGHLARSSSASSPGCSPAARAGWS